MLTASRSCSSSVTYRSTVNLCYITYETGSLETVNKHPNLLFYEYAYESLRRKQTHMSGFLSEPVLVNE